MLVLKFLEDASLHGYAIAVRPASSEASCSGRPRTIRPRSSRSCCCSRGVMPGGLVAGSPSSIGRSRVSAPRGVAFVTNRVKRWPLPGWTRPEARGPKDRSARTSDSRLRGPNGPSRVSPCSPPKRTAAETQRRRFPGRRCREKLGAFGDQVDEPTRLTIIQS